MFGSPLDNMLAQYSQYRQSEPTGAPSTAPTPTTPAPGSGSFFSAASPITASGTSTGSSPFGQGFGIPDLSNADPATLARLMKGMEGLIWNASPGGGYIHGDHTAGPGTNYGPYYKGQPPASDPTANKAAADFYSFIGGLPTRPIGTPALNALPGYSPRMGPSFNDRLGNAGPYGGPFSFPGWP